jgi:hypothetical protein
VKTKKMRFATTKARLLRLAAFLDKLPAKRFDYNHWVGLDWEGKPDLSCGTTACALGWATTMPFFRKLGLYIGPRDDVCLKGAPRPEWWREDMSIKSAMTVFGLDKVMTELLFVPNSVADIGDRVVCSPDSGATAKGVARHIRKVVRLLEAERVAVA